MAGLERSSHPSPRGRSRAETGQVLPEDVREQGLGGQEERRTADSSASAFVLAGGQSRRMGRDKALLTLAGQPLIVHALNAVRASGFSPSIAGARSDLSHFAPVIQDPNPGLGPLSGICAALEISTTRNSVFLPVDLPLLPSSLLTYLVRHAEITSAAITLPSICGLPNTFPVVLDNSVLPLLKSELKGGRRGCMAAFEAAARAFGQSISLVPVELLAQSGHVAHPRSLPAALWFQNLNMPADLVRAERYFPAQIA